MKQISSSFGDWIKQCRQTQDLTQAELAHQAGCSVSTLEKIESGQRRPSRQMAKCLARSLNFQPEDIDSFIAFARAQQPTPPLPVPKSHIIGTAKPESLTPFIGRKQEVASLIALLQQSDVRLVTLVGPGGVGKTRLGLEVATRLASIFVDGVAFVELASLQEPSFVASAIMHTLRLKEGSSTSAIEFLAAAMQEKHILLVLDNLEHLTAASSLLDTLLETAPWLKILVTSRTPIHLPSEHLFKVTPMSLPDVSALPPFTMLTQYDAVQLFISRAQAVNPTFQLSTTTAQAVAEICNHLDGLPLAIELAAVQSKRLTLTQLLVQLSNHLSLPNRPEGPARHQTLTNAVEWSYHLLPAKSQGLFVYLTVFVGSFSAEAAEAVCCINGMTNREIQSGLSVLVEHSLLKTIANGQGNQRFILLDTIREYGLTRLATDPTTAAQLHQQHAHYYFNLARHAMSHMFGSEQNMWLDHLEKEHDNLRLAIKWFRQENNIEMAAKLSASLWQFWWVRGYLGEGRNRLESLLAVYPQPTLVRLLLCQGAGFLAWLQGDALQAEKHFRESLHLSQTLGNQKEQLAFALTGLGWALLSKGSYQAAQVNFSESLNLCRELEDKRGIAWSLTGLGWVMVQQGIYEKAQAYCQESLTLSRRLGDEQSIAFSLIVLGKRALVAGDYEKANSFYTESISLCAKIGNKTGLNYSFSGLGWVALFRNDFEEARRLCAESLKMSRRLKDKRGTVLALNGLAWAFLSQGDYAQAHGHWQESQILSSEINDGESQILSLTGLGWATLYRGDVAKAEDYFHQAVQLSRQLRYALDEAMTSIGLGWTALLSGKLEEGQRLLQETLAWCQRQETTFGMALTINGLGIAALASGNSEKAYRFFKELLSLSAETNDKGGIIWAAEGLAGVAGSQGKFARAAMLWGAARRLRQAFDFPMPPVLEELSKNAIQIVQSQLDESTWWASWAKGEAMTLADLVRLELDVC